MNSTNNNQLLKQFAQYLFPSVASLFSLSLYILADTFFVANGVGSIGVAALNIAIPAYSVINATGLMIGIGGGVLTAISRGQHDERQANQIFNTAVWIAFGLGLLFTVLGILFAHHIALLLGASELSAGMSTQYIRTMLSFSVFFLLNNTLNALVRNDNNPRLAMIAMVANSLSNVVLDYVFIMRFGWGMWGAAFATGLSPIIGLLILSLHWIKKANGFTFERCWPRLSLTLSIFRGGIANFITELGNGVIIVLFNYTLMRLAGDIAVAAYGIVANISLVISYIFLGIGQGMQPVISLQFGQGNLQNCHRVLHMALCIAAALGAVCLVVGLLLPEQLTVLFNSENNTALAEITVPAMRIYFTCFLFMGPNLCCTSYFQSTLQTWAASLLSISRGFAFVFLGTLLLPNLLDLTGVWLITPIAEIGGTLLCLVLLMRKTRTVPETTQICLQKH